MEESRPEAHYFSLDIITSLLLASRREFRRSDIIEGVVELKRAVTFEMRDYSERTLSADDEIRAGVEELLDEGLRSGWVEATTMRYSDRCRQDVPLRLRECLAGDPTLIDPLDRIMAHLGLRPNQ